MFRSPKWNSRAQSCLPSQVVDAFRNGLQPLSGVSIRSQATSPSTAGHSVACVSPYPSTAPPLCNVPPLTTTDPTIPILCSTAKALMNRSPSYCGEVSAAAHHLQRADPEILKHQFHSAYKPVPLFLPAVRRYLFHRYKPRKGYPFSGTVNLEDKGASSLNNGSGPSENLQSVLL